MVENTVIIGSGAGAYSAVKAMRAEGYQGDIHVFSDTDRAPYNPMLTTYYAVGKLKYSGMFPFGEGADFWEKHGAIFHPKDPITSLDAIGKTVSSKSGLTMGFTHCLIASGASPFMPPVPGYESKKLYMVRTVEDAQKLLDAANNKPKRVIVVGASMVGVKVVELFKKAGAEVCLADMAPHIFPLAAHPNCAKEVQLRMEEQGISLRFGAGLTEVEETDDGVRIHFGENAKPEYGDIAVICIGVRANLQFVNREQIDMDRGILVDEHMESSVQGIYAAGDVAQGMDVTDGKKKIIGLWASALMQGRTAGLNIAGKPTQYKGSLLHNITHFMDMDFVGMGNVQDYTRMETMRTEEGLSMFFYQGDKLVGANFLDKYLSSGVLRNAFVNGDTVYKSGKHTTYSTQYAHLLEELIGGEKA